MKRIFAMLRLRHRSNGVRVSRHVGLAIMAGNAARTRRDWPAAVLAYRAALRYNPSLAHIWVQYGHALRESGDTETALDAYRNAVRANPNTPDAALHVGHLARDAGELAEANEAYLIAATLDASLSEATFEFMRTRVRTSDIASSEHRDHRIVALEARLGLAITTEELAIHDPVVGELAYDITDLFAFLSRSRVPTGIQRVQLEVLSDVLRRNDGRIRRLLCFTSGHAGWITIPTALFQALLDVGHHGGSSDDTVWKALLGRCFLAMVNRDPYRFPADAVLINLGTNWMDPAYLLAVRAARQNYGVRFVALVFDIIPVLYPNLFAETLARDFTRWIKQLFTVADGYVTISQTTAEDLRRFAVKTETPIEARAITVVPLDVDFRAVERQTPKRSLAQLGLANQRYVLMVSTLEPRKNHLGAFAAWQQLARTIGEKQLPLLVCIGGKGWLNAEIHARLTTTPLLKRKVRVLSSISDAELALLYSECFFTLYPSFYEGWGLPVTESLCYGKVPAISNTASMTEAGGTFAVYFDPHDPADIVKKLTTLIVDSDYRRALEARIIAGFRPRRWRAVADQIEATAHLDPA